MGSERGLGLHFIFTSIFLFATSYTCLGVGNITVVCSEQERLALLKFKESVQDYSSMLSSWVGSDCCQWERIHCNDVTGHVEKLHLRGYNDYLVSNEVSSSLAELRHLKYLDLSNNFFRQGQIPQFIGSLKQLTYLNLSYSGFQGNIPHHIGNLSNLKVLDLRNNDGLMSDDMAWTFGLSSLELLDLSYVNLSGAHNWDMVLYISPLLKEISLHSCRLSNVDLGPFLNSSRILPKIKHLDLGFNSLKSPLPGFFRNMTSLSFLDLSCSNLGVAWNFANFLNMLPSLSDLSLSRCGIHNTHLSPFLLNSSTLSIIQHLDLSENSIGGIFPSVLTNMSSLRVLYLVSNNLNSLVPIMSNLLDLDLSFNKFKQIEHVGILRQCHLKKLRAAGNGFDMEMIGLPINVSECSQYALEGLDLSLNKNGTIPEALGRLANLRGLFLSDSSLTGPIPKSLGRLRFLERLYLSHNKLIGPIPTFRGKLYMLDLSFNQLNGSIPESFGRLATLKFLNLQSNRLTGPIPASLGSQVLLQEIQVSSNLINGTIPVSIGQLAKLYQLDISNNSLEGVVSEAHFANLSTLTYLDASFNTKLTFNVSHEWMPPFQLQTLELSSCNITNGFLQWLQNQRNLDKLVLSNTSIVGPLPTWFRKMPIIPFIDLSHNKLSGPLTNLPNTNTNTNRENVYRYRVEVSALLLVNNIFNESIPRSLCRRTDLELLDLSRNMLIGKLPKCLENLQGLVSMIFSSNLLSGIIPSYIGFNRSSLSWLKLNDNNFIGKLPRELGNLRDLRVLDVGDNKLFGNIPQWIGENLTSLMVLRLHGNNFTGEIPESLCKMSNLQILDLAYNNLRGIIPRCLSELNAMAKGAEKWWRNGTFDSNENVIQVMKGVDLEYTTTWDMVFNMDLSCNKLVGKIPVELTALYMLMGLNLSNNHLNGNIPDNIGNMMALFSLDLSGNELIGNIPSSIAALTFLSHLNLSHNNLSGRIPTGRQLQTLTDPSIYVGNKDLCGPPLPKNCSNHEDPTTITNNKKYEATDEPTNAWLFYLDVTCGFATGFWGIIGVLLFKKQWRCNLFMFFEKIMDKIYVAVVVKVVKMKRGREDT